MYKGKIIACITNRRLVRGDFLAQIERVAAMEMVDWIIVREKDLTSEAYRALFAQVVRIAHKHGKKCIAHGWGALGAEPEDAAVLQEAALRQQGRHAPAAEERRLSPRTVSECGADGIHLPLDALRTWRAASAQDGRQPAMEEGAVKLVGASAHSVAELAEAASLGSHYATFSPIFATACKPDAAPLGAAALAAACKEALLPVFALGGVGMNKLEACLEAGAAGCCMMSALMR